MKLRKKIAILLALLLLASLPLIGAAIADAGDYSGASDYGGSSSGSSSDDCDGAGVLFYYALRIGCVIGEAAENAGCSHGQVILFEIVFFAVVVGLLALFVRVRRKTVTRGTNAGAQTFVRSNTPQQSVLGHIRENDPNFSEEDLLEKTKNLYLRYIDCRSSGDLSPIRPYFTEALLAQTEKELNGLRAANVAEHTERLAILDARLSGFYRSEGMDVLAVKLSVRFVSYRRDNTSGGIVSGSSEAEQFRTVSMQMVRPTGVLTAAREEGTSVKNCPYCGAPLSLNESNRCPYCDSVLPAAKDDWIIRLITQS